MSGKFATTLKSITRAIKKSHYPTLNARAHENVAFYSQRTGGEVVNVKDDEFGKALERVVGNLAARYSLGFVPDASRLDNRFHKLRVSVDVPETLRKVGRLEVRVRQGYFARKTVEDADKIQR